MSTRVGAARRLLLFALFVLFFLALSAGLAKATALPNRAPSANPVWREVNVSDAAVLARKPSITTRQAHVVAADTAALLEILGRAPLAESPGTAEPAELALPLPDGGYGAFRVEDSPVMEPGLAAKYPQLRTYRAIGLDDPTAYGRLDWTPAGFHALILSTVGTIYIDPYSPDDTSTYLSYYKRDYLNVLGKAFQEGVPIADSQPMRAVSETPTTVGPAMRTYRLALAATGEYTQFHGGTREKGLAAVVTSINRVDAVYERDLAIHLSLVDNNDALIYTNKDTDPYTNNDAYKMLAENRATLDTLIGPANYDIGHVFSTGGGGLASLASVCASPHNGSTKSVHKAEGVTGSPIPTGDPFDIDYVVHEMGHQFGANHTFNASTAANCDSANRSGATAYEPGSGSTIMAYAGICAGQNLQLHSDDVFHTGSQSEIIAFVTGGGGSACGSQKSTGNEAPKVEAGPGYTIPARTPFVLTGQATDPDGDSLIYSWEELDAGAAWTAASILPNSDGDEQPRPIFRAYLPATAPTRVFPALSSVLDGSNQNKGESLPTISRVMAFRLTARDNRGGVQVDKTFVTVAGGAGPFRVTAPNQALTWPGYATQKVTWDVAKTDQTPVSCSRVDILFSADGGLTFDYMLAAGTANDGAQTVTVPSVATTQGRVKVACAGNIFFDISNADMAATRSAAPVRAITIKKVSKPAGGSAFHFTGQLGDFVLDDGGSLTFDGLEPGRYLVQELAADSWAFDSISCLGGQTVVSGRSATINLVEGQHVSCTFTSRGDDLEELFLPLLRS